MSANPWMRENAELKAENKRLREFAQRVIALGGLNYNNWYDARHALVDEAHAALEGKE